jgi:hypothetical protein
MSNEQEQQLKQQSKERLKLLAEIIAEMESNQNQLGSIAYAKEQE